MSYIGLYRVRKFCGHLENLESRVTTQLLQMGTSEATSARMDQQPGGLAHQTCNQAPFGSVALRLLEGGIPRHGPSKSVARTRIKTTALT